MNAKRTLRKAAGATKADMARAREPGRDIEVTAEEERHLVEDVAYFHAERYRNVEPGKFREEDRQQAASEVRAVLKRHRKR